MLLFLVQKLQTSISFNYIGENVAMGHDCLCDLLFDGNKKALTLFKFENV